MKKIACSVLTFILLCSGGAQGAECKKGCTLEEIYFSGADTVYHRSRYELVFGSDGTPIPSKIPVLALYPPAFHQNYIGIEVKSESRYRLSSREIKGVNECIERRRRCLVPWPGNDLRPGDAVVFDYEIENISQRELGFSFATLFADGLDSRVILRGFKGRYLARGAKIRNFGEEVIFESTGDGYLIMSEIPNWGLVAKMWTGTADPDAVRKIASEIFPGGVQPRLAINLAQQWISENIKYKNDPRTVVEMQIPQDVSATISSREGDCKALVLLLQSLLASAGVESQPAYTRFNDKKSLFRFDPEIPIPSYFDHVFLYIPSLKIYVDATLRKDQLDEEITDYMSFSLNTVTGNFECFSGVDDCKGVPRYQAPR